MPTQVTIVIPAKNEALCLPRLLTSLSTQDYPHLADTRVYVADAGSTDETVRIARSFESALRVEVIPGGLPAVGRNAGAALAETRYVLFLDADVELVDRTLLRRAIEAAEAQQLHCVTTSIGCSSGDWRDEAIFAMNNVVQQASRWVSPFATGMFMLFERAEFNRLGGFDVRALYAEDYLLSKQVAGARFAVVAGKVFTSNRRFERMGRGRIVRMFVKTAMNAHDLRYFQRDQGYWEA